MNYTRSAVAALAFLILAALAPALSGIPQRPIVAARPPAVNSPVVPSRDIQKCNVSAYPNQTKADFANPNKESRGAIGPRLKVNPSPRYRDQNNELVRAVLCGSPARGPNKLAYESIITALSGGVARHLSDTAWQRGVRMLVEEAWVPSLSKFTCGVLDTPGTQTVFGLRRGGALVLDINTVEAKRHSCYAFLAFTGRDGVKRQVKLRLDCLLQATTRNPGGVWSVALLD